ncbi:TonB-dependent siderophore receptor [Marinomonas aquiplantarum]|uniref:Iron complex outermembrane receptor protein n=1 Tax=Marinomonas aquiplantarum TaxID=491951 RepID=A0A366D866_9GAMM|nr:TonB-dependent siderophore receptor [Marinomonas aquiplantarum]RBO86241.1 iron complex outermembrane receptor protein [Marinomonas aquiplantarum]
MKSTQSFRPTLIALAIAVATGHAIAEDTIDTNDLSTLEVKGQTYRNTATKTQLDAEETPQAISIIKSETLEERGVESLAEAVRYSSGINTELRGGSVTRLDLFNIRGFDNDTVLLDGLPLLFNGWNLQPQIDAAVVDQIEIFKGPTSTLYGEMPPGGMVNIISKSPQEDSANSVEITLGSDNKKQVQFDSTGAISDKVNYRVIGLARQKDGQSVTAEEERILIAPSLDIQLSDSTFLNLNMYYQNDPEMGVYSALPSKGTVNSNINGKLNSDAYAGDENWETYEREELLLGYKLEHEINDTWSFLQNTRFTFADAYQQNTYSGSTSLNSDERTLNRRAYITDEKSQGINLDNQFSAIFDTGSLEHNILIGLDYLKLESDIKYEDAVAPSIDLYDPDYNQIVASQLDFAASGYSSDFTINKEQTGLYLQDQIRMDQWVFIMGGRYDNYKYSETGRGSTEADDDQNQLSGRIGALYELDNGFSPFINFAQSFEPVSGSDRLGNAFKTSTADQIEAGIKFQNADTLASVTAFNIVKSNVLTRDPNGGTYDKVQVGEVTSNGLEVELTKALTEELNATLAYTYQDVEVSKSNDGIQGNTPVWTPEQQVSVWLGYQPKQGSLLGASFGAGLRYVGEMQMDAANSDTVPSYTLVDLSIGYDLAQLSANWQGASVQFSVSNAFDETYYTCYDTSSCWFGADRSFELTGRYEF